WWSPLPGNEVVSVTWDVTPKGQGFLSDRVKRVARRAWQFTKTLGMVQFGTTLTGEFANW
ncbi:MAG: hypothetical protein QMC83_08620, partial [Thermodesulfovibrionales bacterium]|nr:hypothetical protein [Thermodesulfovibrionales bacterium]